MMIAVHATKTQMQCHRARMTPETVFGLLTPRCEMPDKTVSNVALLDLY